MKNEWSIRMLLFAVLGLGVFVVVVVGGAKFTSGNTQTLQMMVTAFSVMTGVLMAIITVSGDPSLLYRGSARLAKVHIAQIDRVMFRYKCLFYTFLLAMVTGLITATLIHVSPEATITQCFERCAFGLGATALFWSFGLPVAMVKAQRQKLVGEQERRTEQERYDLPDEPPQFEE